MNKLTPYEIAERRKQFFKEMNTEFPPIENFVVTSSGIVEPLPDTQEAWDNFHEHLQFVEGADKRHYAS